MRQGFRVRAGESPPHARISMKFICFLRQPGFALTSNSPTPPQADRIAFDPQVYAPSNDEDVPVEANDEPSSEAGVSSAPPSTGDARSDEDEDEGEEEDEGAGSADPIAPKREPPDVGALPLMRLCEPDYGARRGASAPPSPCLLYTSPSPRDQRGSRMPSSA